MVAVFGWIVTLLLTTACVFGTYDVRSRSTYITPAYSTFEAAFYNGFSRIAWSIAMMWVVIACVKVRHIFCHLLVNLSIQTNVGCVLGIWWNYKLLFVMGIFQTFGKIKLHCISNSFWLVVMCILFIDLHNRIYQHNCSEQTYFYLILVKSKIYYFYRLITMWD